MGDRRWKIAIIGAGPAGCMLARLLLQASIPRLSVIVFEAEESTTSVPARPRYGGTLDLHPKSGLRALKKAQLYEEFLNHARYDGSFFELCDKSRNTYFRRPGDKPGAKNGKPEVDRAQLRSILLDALPANIVRWGHRLQRVAGSDRTLHFQDGQGRSTWTEGGFDLVVGADGAWSQVRGWLSQDKPIYSGIKGCNLLIPSQLVSPTVEQLVNHGSIFAFSEGKAIMGQKMGGGNIDVSVWRTGTEDEEEEEEEEAGVPAVGQAMKQRILHEFGDWDPQLLSLVQDAQPDTLVQRSLYMLRPSYRWPTRKGVTLIGDAAHLMAPFAGEGVNLALEDAVALTDAIIKAFRTDISSSRSNTAASLTSEISRFEGEMFQRAERAQRLTCGMLQDMFFTEGAPRKSIESYLIRRATYDLNPWLAPLMHPFIALGIYSFYIVFKLFV